MKSICLLSPARHALPAMLAALCAIGTSFAVPSPHATRPQLSAETARKEIARFYDDWGKARVKADVKAFEAGLADDFKAILPNQTMTKKEFIAAISTPPEKSGLVRFTSSILTVQKQGELWVAVITEKMEGERKIAEGKVLHGYALFVTKDTFRKTGDVWQAVSSEVIGNENWVGGKTPPFKDWAEGGV